MREHVGCGGISAYGYTFGGWASSSFNNDFTYNNTIDKIDYFYKKTSTISATLPVGVFLNSTVGNRNFIYIGGGLKVWGGTGLRSISRLSVTSPEVLIPLGDILAQGRSTGLNSTSSKTFGYFYGGASLLYGGGGGTPVFSIESFRFNGEVVGLIGQSLSFPHINHAAHGNDTTALICGGRKADSSGFWTLEGANSVTEFLYATLIPRSLGVSMGEQKNASSAVGTNADMYIGGGFTILNPTMTISQSVDKISLINPYPRITLGVGLSQPRAAHGSLSDYGAGFSI